MEIGSVPMLNMMGKTRGQHIAEQSTREDNQLARVRIELKVSDKDRGTYNIDTGEYEGGKEPKVLYEGRARFAPIRWGVDSRNTHVFNSSTTTRLRFQLPYGSLPDDVPAGTRVWVIEAPYSPHMEGGCAVVTGDVMNDDNAARTLETEWNSDDGVNE